MATSPDLPKIDGHEVVRELGRGAMGAVYLARDATLRREVAVKVLVGADFADPETLARFRHEAEAIARLRHPNIVQVFSSGKTDGVPWFAMEYVEGAPVSVETGRGPEGARRAATVMEAVARALHHAHERGLVHRDVKPANILVDAAGRAVVTDFGVAKWYRPQDGDTSKRMTIEGSLLGTVSYMAPEQAGGDVEAIGPHTDVWAAGVVLYEILAGAPPFSGRTMMETIQKILKEPVPSPAWARPDVPRALEGITMRCLQRDPAQRYPSAAALADDLAAFVEGKPLPSQADASASGGFWSRLFGKG